MYPAPMSLWIVRCAYKALNPLGVPVSLPSPESQTFLVACSLGQTSVFSIFSHRLASQGIVLVVL